MTQRILVVGMGRSGTTFVAGYLGACGAFLDSVNWANEHPLGRLINDTLFAKAFGVRKGRPYGEIPDGEIQVGDEWLNLAGHFIRYLDLQTAASGLQHWAFKDPRATILRQMWEPNFHHVVAVFRDPRQVVASYKRRGWIEGPEAEAVGLRYWKRFNRSLARTIQSREPSSVSVVRFAPGVEERLALVARRCGLTAGPEVTSFRFDEEVGGKADAAPLDEQAAEMLRWLQDHETRE